MPDAESPPPLHGATLLEALVRHRVQFVIVGGFAAQIHGAARPTGDLDICPAWDPRNTRRLSSALEELRATLRLRPELGPATVGPNPELLRALSATLWRSPSGNIDVLIGIADGPGTLVCFPELAERATEVRLVDGTLLVAGLPDLIRAKEIAGRPKDREALPELHALLNARHVAAALPDLAGPAPAPSPPVRHLRPAALLIRPPRRRGPGVGL